MIICNAAIGVTRRQPAVSLTRRCHGAVPYPPREEPKRRGCVRAPVQSGNYSSRASTGRARAKRTKLQSPERRGHRSEEHTSELQSLRHLVCRLLLEKKKKKVA